MKRSSKDILVIGFALFSMFFGAGNVIFPPYLGLSCGGQWTQGFIYYFIADIGLALVALFAVQRCGGYEGVTRPLGHIPSTVLMCVIVLCIGPMLAIPRTAASTFEMSVRTFAPSFPPLLFSVLFFLVVALLSIRESAVVDIVGKILTPMLMIGLLTLIIKGTMDPIGPVIQDVQVPNVPITGIEAGYQTMDVLAAVIFGIIIAKSAAQKGYKDGRSQNKVVMISGLVAGVCLFVIYFGLTYLGATASSLFDVEVDRTHLITQIVHAIFGQWGMVLFAIVVALACITTAVALISSTADFFATLTKNKLKYQVLVVVISVFSCAASAFGLNQIISIAAPILDVVYPPTLFIIFLSYVPRLTERPWAYRLGALGALVSSVLIVLAKNGVEALGIVRSLPLFSFGFGWLVPTLICAAAGLLIPGGKKERG